MASKQPFNIIDVVLIVGVIGLAFLLVYIIWEPGRMLAQMEDYKWESRARMNAIRIAEQQYYGRHENYTANMDSLVYFVKEEMTAADRDSLFPKLYLYAFHPDSMRFAPMSRTAYELAVDDTTSIPRWTVNDPDGYGYISSLTNPDEHNKASWEQ